MQRALLINYVCVWQHPIVPKVIWPKAEQEVRSALHSHTLGFLPIHLHKSLSYSACTQVLSFGV